LLAHDTSVNIATPLSVCTEEEQHAVIRILWAEGQKSIFSVSEVSMIGLNISKEVTQVSQMKNS